MLLSLIPESAPFDAPQRAWLNGFLAGWLGLQGATDSTIEPPSTPAATAPVADLPWHDPAMPLDERLKLAEGRSLDDRLMAAMAQLDCGACGYVCRTYSEALARGEETSLSLCSPGGSETAKILKRLVKENPPAAATVAEAPPTSEWSRKNPYPAALIRSETLNKDGSDKDVRHVEIDLGADGPTYRVGDSLGIFPTNCDDLVSAVLGTLGATGVEPVAMNGAELTTRAALVHHRGLAEITDELLTLLADSATDRDESETIRALIDDGPKAGHDVLDLLESFPTARPSPAEFVAALAPLRPRLYSISSSPTKHAGQVHLTVGRVSTVARGRVRKGVASTMLADRVSSGEAIRVFVQPSHGFTIPADPSTPMIMIGPGTGIAPFRAFLHEREAQGATGKTWLFFGDQRSACDFLYEDELNDFAARGVLTRLDTAFSRDQDQKVYVQHRILEHAESVYQWIQEGAHIYVCGDAKRMAADVDQAIREVIRTQGALSPESAGSYLAMLSSSGRYARDVY